MSRDSLLRAVLANPDDDTPRLAELGLGIEVGARRSVEALAAWPGASRLTSLTDLLVSDVPGDDVLRILAASPHLGCLERLELILFQPCTDDGVEALIDSPNLTKLRQVRLHDDEHDCCERTLARARERFAEFQIG